MWTVNIPEFTGSQALSVLVASLLNTKSKPLPIFHPLFPNINNPVFWWYFLSSVYLISIKSIFRPKIFHFLITCVSLPMVWSDLTVQHLILMLTLPVKIFHFRWKTFLWLWFSIIIVSAGFAGLPGTVLSYVQQIVLLYSWCFYLQICDRLILPLDSFCNSFTWRGC